MTHEPVSRSLELIPLSDWVEVPPEDMANRAEAFLAEMRRRRTVRDFSDRPVPREIIESCLLTAGTAPSGANLQPWHFVVISDRYRKRLIREAAEVEEAEFYAARAGAEWLEALSPLGTDPRKPFLEIAPWLIVIFAQKRTGLAPGENRKTYYFNESVGIATGLLIAALHHCGLATLTHTPAPMGFLNAICERPSTEKPFLILVVGYPAADARTPRFARIKKSLAAISSWFQS